MSDTQSEDKTPVTSDDTDTVVNTVAVTELPEPTWEEIEAWLEENTWV